MKKKLYTILVIFMSIMSLEAQEWFPVGAKWTYETFYPFDQWGGTYTDVITCEEEVEIDGINARVIKGGTMCSYSNDGESIMYHNKSEDIVYTYLDGEFKVYFDFSKKAGESYSLNYQDNDQGEPQFKAVTITIDSVVTKKINGFDVRYQYIKGWRGPIIEYIGGAGSFYPESGSCDFELSSGLRCYISDNMEYYSHPIYEINGCSDAKRYKECFTADSQWSLFYPAFVKSDMQGGDPMGQLWDPSIIKFIERVGDYYKLEFLLWGESHNEYFYVREDPYTGKIWVKDDYNEERLAMDLTLEIGDEYNSNKGRYIVDDIYTDDHGRKCIKLNGPPYHQMGITVELVFIEGIGPTFGLYGDCVVICKQENSEIVYSIDDPHFKDCAPVRVEQIAENYNVKLYPNPAKDSFTFEVDRNDVIGEVKMFDITGKLIMSIDSNDLEVDISKLKSGVYFVKVKINNRFVTSKIVKL